MQQLKRALVLTFPFEGESTSSALITLISRISDEHPAPVGTASLRPHLVCLPASLTHTTVAVCPQALAAERTSNTPSSLSGPPPILHKDQIYKCDSLSAPNSPLRGFIDDCKTPHAPPGPGPGPGPGPRNLSAQVCIVIIIIIEKLNFLFRR